MPNRFVHEVHALIAFGRPYSEVHRRKDAFSRVVPGIAHRKVRHRRYRAFDVSSLLVYSCLPKEKHRIERIAAWKGVEIAESYMVSLAHELEDKIWDFDDVSPSERLAIREYWEGLCVWLVLNPQIVKSWAGIDVLTGRIQRVVNGVEIWEDAPELISEYAVLRSRAHFLMAKKKRLREAIRTYGT